MLLSGNPREIIANPALPTPKSDRAKRPCALFKISNEQTHVPVAASHYKTRQTYIRLLFAQLIAWKKKTKALWSQTEVVSTKRGYLAIVCYKMITPWMRKERKVFHNDYLEVNKSPQIRALLTVGLAFNGDRLCERYNALITAIAKQSVYKVTELPLMLWCPLPLSSHSTPCLLCVCWRSQMQLSDDSCGCVNQSPVSQIPNSSFNCDVTSVIIKTLLLPLMKGSHTSRFEPLKFMWMLKTF